MRAPARVPSPGSPLFSKRALAVDGYARFTKKRAPAVRPAAPKRFREGGPLAQPAGGPDSPSFEKDVVHPEAELAAIHSSPDEHRHEGPVHGERQHEIVPGAEGRGVQRHFVIGFR